MTRALWLYKKEILMSAQTNLTSEIVMKLNDSWKVLSALRNSYRKQKRNIVVTEEASDTSKLLDLLTNGSMLTPLCWRPLRLRYFNGYEAIWNKQRKKTKWIAPAKLTLMNILSSTRGKRVIRNPRARDVMRGGILSARRMIHFKF